MNGDLSGDNEWPFITHLKIYSLTGGSFQCGGTLIDRQFVLTAAHCVEYKGTILQDVDVYFGETSLVQDEDSNFHVKAAQVFVHPGRTTTDIGPYDIAILKLPYPVQLTDTVNIACLPTNAYMFQPGEVCQVVGWGATETGQTTVDLFHFDTHLMSNADCTTHWGNRITDDMQCVFDTVVPQRLQSVCPGDSGGPLACHQNGRYYVMGAASWVQKCDYTHQTQQRMPNVFAKVTSYLDWIHSTIASNTDTPIN